MVMIKQNSFDKHFHHLTTSINHHLNHEDQCSDNNNIVTTTTTNTSNFSKKTMVISPSNSSSSSSPSNACCQSQLLQSHNLTTIATGTSTTQTTITSSTQKINKSRGQFKKFTVKVIEWIRKSLALGKNEVRNYISLLFLLLNVLMLVIFVSCPDGCGIICTIKNIITFNLFITMRFVHHLPHFCFIEF